MFSVNGVALDNPDLGWVVLEQSSVVSSVAYDLQSLAIPGRDGVISLPAARARPPLFPITVETPRANQRALRAVFMQRRLILTEDEQDGIEALVELSTITPQTYGPADEIVEVTALLRLPGVFWRDTTATTSDPVAIDSAEVEVELLAGLTAPVRDAIIRVKGGATTLHVEDSAGSFFEYTDVLGGTEYLRFESATGRAYVTTSDTWAGGTEVTGDIANGPGPYYFELTPQFVDPAEPAAAVTVTTTARTGSPTIEVRARRAHAV